MCGWTRPDNQPTWRHASRHALGGRCHERAIRTGTVCAASLKARVPSGGGRHLRRRRPQRLRPDGRAPCQLPGSHAPLCPCSRLCGRGRPPVRPGSAICGGELPGGPPRAHRARHHDHVRPAVFVVLLPRGVSVKQQPARRPAGNGARGHNSHRRFGPGAGADRAGHGVWEPSVGAAAGPRHSPFPAGTS